MADLGSAVVAVFGALAVGYGTQFLAEDFRRFRDGSALAAGLAGELGSYRTAYPILIEQLSGWRAAIENGHRPDAGMRKIERPVDVFFDASVAKLGLLGTQLVEDVVFVYSNVRAFRMSLEILTTHHADMSNAELLNRSQGCIETLKRAMERGGPLLIALHARADQGFLKRMFGRK